MNCTNCGAKIPDDARSCPACGATAGSPAAPAQRPSIAVDQRVRTNAGQVVGVDAGKGGLRDGLDASVTQEVGEVAPGGVVAGTISISGVQGPVHVGGQQTYYQGDLAYDVRGLDNPYLGLRAYTYKERDRYAGREEDVRRSLAALTRPGDERTLLFVTGASGSGKSSFAQAGLLPALEKHYQQQAFTVKWAVFRPGEKPLAALAIELRTLGLAAEGIFAPAAPYQSALTQPAGPDQVSILIVDQFEELFTQAEAGQRDALFAILAALPPFRAGRLHVIATMRADYLPDLFEHRALYDIAKTGADLRAMSEDQLKVAIQRPLQAMHPQAGKRFQDALLKELAHDAAEDAGRLPLLQVTLEDLWRNGILTADYYDDLTDAIRKRADEVYTKKEDAQGRVQPRPPEEQARILKIFLALVDVSADDQVQRDVRRTRRLDYVAGDREAERLVEELATARLLVTDTRETGEGGQQVETVDIIHESLLKNWARLSQAIQAEREQLQQRSRFELRLATWLEEGRPAGRLLQSVDLAEAENLQRLGDVAVRSREAVEFIARSVQERDRVRRRSQRITAIVAGVLGVLFVAALVAAWQTVIARNDAQAASTRAVASEGTAVAERATAQAASTRAVEQQKTAEANATEVQRQADIALSRQLAAQAQGQLGRDLSLSALLYVQSFLVTDTVEARGGLLDLLQQHPRLVASLQRHDSSVNSVAFSPDGKTLASGSDDNTIILWDVADPAQPRPIGQPLTGHSGPVTSVAFSPDGRTLASGSDDNTIRLWDVADPAQPRPLGPPLTGHSFGVTSVAFSPDGRTLASGGPETILLWDVSDPAEPRSLGQPLTGNSGQGGSVAFSPDGRTLAAGSDDNTIRLWDVADPDQPRPIGQPLTGHSNDVTSVAFSPDGKTLASGSNDNTIRLWDVSNSAQPRSIDQPLTGHNGVVTSVAFSPDGRTLASGSWDQIIRLWDVSDPDQPRPIGQPLTGHSDRITSVAFSPDGRILASGSRDRTNFLWDVADPVQFRPIGQPLTGHSSRVESVAFSPDNRKLASGGRDKSIILWDVTDPSQPHPIGQPLTGHSDTVFGVAFSPDSQVLASASQDNIIILWNISDPAQPWRIGQPLTGHSDSVSSVIFSPDGRMLASGSDNCTIILWNVADPARSRPIGQPLRGHSGYVTSVAFSPDGRTLVSGSDDHTIILWNIADPARSRPIGQPLTGHSGTVNSITFSPDGRMLASTARGEAITVWEITDLAQPKTIGQTPIEDFAGAWSVAWSPDGRTLASDSGNLDNTIILWDITKTAQPWKIGRLLPAHYTYGSGVTSVAFSPDGRALASGSTDSSVTLWDIDPRSWAARACRIAGRNLSQAEWRQYIGDRPYRKTCPDLPAGE